MHFTYKKMLSTTRKYEGIAKRKIRAKKGSIHRVRTSFQSPNGFRQKNGTTLAYTLDPSTNSTAFQLFVASCGFPSVSNAWR
jgi:hypothetical protein